MPTTTTAFERLYDALLQDGRAVKDCGDRKAMAQCPSHDDGQPSLSVTGIEGQVLLHCHAGCDPDTVIRSLGLTMADLFDEPRGTRYNYPDGRIVHRSPDKRFRQSGNTKGTSLFRADKVGDASTVYVCEGEKDVHAVESAGGVAVCPAMGAGKAHKFDWSPLKGKTVVVIADHDEPGKKHAAEVVDKLRGIAASTTVVEAVVGKDAADHVAAGHSLDELMPVKVVTLSPPVTPDVPFARPLFPSPSAPLDVAIELYEQFRAADGLRTLVPRRGGWMRWRTTHWAEMDAAELRSHLYHALGPALYEVEIMVKGEPTIEEKPWHPDKRKIANVIEAMQAVGHLSAEIEAPAWIDLHSAAKTPASQMISCANGVLDLSSRTVIGHTPALFNTVSVPFDYDPDAAEPIAWKTFLSSVWPDDTDSVELLQEWFGYAISGRTDMQKILLIIGPTRSGKGTVARVLTALLGRGHVSGPTLASLGTNFGLSPLLGKPLAIISDARLGGEPAHAVVERLLSISGEDLITVDLKFKEPWSGRLPTRFAILSNELPKFRDSSGAIANRLLILQMTNSFLGKEDRTLDDRLAAELPGILNWSLEGLDRLVSAGRFTVPSAADDATKLMMDLASPMSAFVRDCCERGPKDGVTADRLYEAWKAWAEDNGHHGGAKSTFGRDLRAVVPELKVSQPKVGAVRVRTYVGIGLLPVHPVHGYEDAGHSVDHDPPDQEPARAQPVQPNLPDMLILPCTGCGTTFEGGNALVNGLCTGCTGTSPFKAEQSASPPGAPTAATPGMTDRVQRILAKTRPPLCEECQRAPARSESNLCDFCSAKARAQAVAAAQSRLNGAAS